uniref:Uncharacterized protein n=1 Tax=Mucochytrium quahogii TaxID=96639 RepID=A0A7S2W577_9STRA|mmetsp:Transcript_13542/g.29126  ORF Transcript_13542/g.29126 Transcript_13542/m.29126 type:complete len:499 (+) Transcript_13542:388-1884(+)
MDRVRTVHGHLSQREVREVDVCIVGGGFSGLINAIKLVDAGIDSFVIVEREDQVGGTWKVNKYPGCACDVPSTAYLPLSLLPGWTPSRLYPCSDEIQGFMKGLVARYDLGRRCVVNTSVVSCRWQGAVWHVATSSNITFIAKFVICCTGVLSSANGTFRNESFKGSVVHTTDWDDGQSVKGKRVAVVGTGASAVQVVTALSKENEFDDLFVFQRTAVYCTARNDRPISKAVADKIRSSPSYGDGKREWYHSAVEETLFKIFHNKVLNKRKKEEIHSIIRATVEDKTTADALCPEYDFGCKRVIVSDDYYACFNNPKVHLVAEGVEGLTENGVRTMSGYQVENLDMVICATGFDVSRGYLKGVDVYGREGRLLSDEWKDGAKTFLGIHCHGFPNLFLMVGPQAFSPYTNTVHLILEQSAYIIKQIQKKTLVEVSRQAQDKWVSKCRELGAQSVWATCTNWYNGNGGDVTSFAGRFEQYKAFLAAEESSGYSSYKHRASC